MRLTSGQTKQAADQFEAQAVPENGQLAPELRKVFGDHTFFLANTGLHIVDHAEPTERGSAGRVVKVASWTDAHRTTLAPHHPESIDVIVEFDTAALKPPCRTRR